jgi:hypothetical protein
MAMFNAKHLSVLPVLLFGVGLSGCVADPTEPGAPLVDTERPHLPAKVALSRLERGLGAGPGSLTKSALRYWAT